MEKTMRSLMILFVALLALPKIVLAAAPMPHATLYKSPQCGCCEEYAKYLEKNGFTVTVVATHDLPLIKRQQAVPAALEGCHTTLLGGYVVEGHVPVATLNKLLTERPAIKGLSLPGMPLGSPGMSGEKAEPFTVFEIAEGPPKVYAVE